MTTRRYQRASKVVIYQAWIQEKPIQENQSNRGDWEEGQDFWQSLSILSTSWCSEL